MKQRTSVAVLGLLSVVVLGGCTSHATGEPTPRTTAGGPGASSTALTATTSRLLPPRPRDIDVSGLDPCKALTTDQEK